MDVITSNQIVYDSGIVNDDYENAFGRRGGRRGSPRRGSGVGREGGRRGGRKRTGLNRAIGVLPVVAGARYLQRRKAEREEREGRQRQSSPSGQKVVGSMITSPSQNQTYASSPRTSNRPPRSTPRPSRTNPLQGRPNMQQNVGLTSVAVPPIEPTPTPNNNKKIALIVGGVLLLGVAAYFYSKRKK